MQVRPGLTPCRARERARCTAEDALLCPDDPGAEADDLVAVAVELEVSPTRNKRNGNLR